MSGKIEKFEGLLAWSQLYVALDAGYLDEQCFSELMNLAIETERIIGGLRVSVERKRDIKLNNSSLSTQHSSLITHHSK
ncbi:MAG: hypothetical protein ABSA82_10960 [Thermacetogeniaceae bacterium]|jgi:hypothetical protein